MGNDSVTWTNPLWHIHISECHMAVKCPIAVSAMEDLSVSKCVLSLWFQNGWNRKVLLHVRNHGGPLAGERHRSGAHHGLRGAFCSLLESFYVFYECVHSGIKSWAAFLGFIPLCVFVLKAKEKTQHTGALFLGLCLWQGSLGVKRGHRYVWSFLVLFPTPHPFPTLLSRGHFNSVLHAFWEGALFFIWPLTLEVQSFLAWPSSFRVLSTVPLQWSLAAPLHPKF